jgi:2-dehydro-3-deoxyphosphogluconate aldolase/(4S)-4-hydroxy-2-oxoglutarate aldolase
MSDRVRALPFPGRLVPVVSLDDEASIEPLAEALVDGGCHVIEVTLRSPVAVAAIARAAAHCDLVVGAGTVLTVSQVDAVVHAGARFVVSPGLDERVVERCQELDVPVLPGIATPSELQRALSLGVDLVKLFPAEAIGGIALLRALAAPFPEVAFVPTGGITADNLPRYLAEPAVAAVGGSWMVAKKLLDAADWGQVRELTVAAVAIASREEPS